MLNKQRIFLIGSDYVFPRYAHAIIRDRAASLYVEVVGEIFLPLGAQDFGEAIKEIAAAKPDMILGTINGDSNVAFFRALQSVRSSTSDMPVMSFSIAEEELSSLNARAIAGDYAAWNYFMSIHRPANQTFIDRFRALWRPPSADRSDGGGVLRRSPLGAGGHESGRRQVGAIRRAIGGQTSNAPEGTVTIDPATQHTSKFFRIGKMRRVVGI